MSKLLAFLVFLFALLVAGPSLTAAPHWAFEPIQPVTPPADPDGWSGQPIDHFIRQKHREMNLKAARQADKRTLARRAYFDLIGLPPQPDVLDVFLNDRAPDVFEKLVEQLLASPHYGERWGRHWMDVVRYSDTAGDNADYPIPEVRLYRDYIIDSFNADKPYDQFVREQIAGDILASQSPKERFAEQVIATGFLALSRRYGTGPGELWHLVLEDSIETTGRAFLGLTLRCARCHDHKYDPITTEDYYGLYGFFASTRYPWAGSEEVESKKFNRMNFAALLPPSQAAQRIQAFEQKVGKLQSEIQRLEKADPALVKELRAELRNLQKPGLPLDLPGAYAVQEDQPIDVCIQIRGDPANRGPVVERNVPKFLARGQKLAIPKGSSGRLQLADWLTRRDNPLTARVMVNRIWQHHFGRGIVDTPSNFGLRGDAPTHPELLDWLAGKFIESGWSIKAMHRLIMSSKTYQLSSDDDAANLQRDPSNRWHWRQDRRRLEAETIRDAMMMVAGTLDLKRPGDHPFPSIKDWSWTQHRPFKEIYPSSHRSVYLMTQRFQRHPFLALFDGPETNTSTDTRRNSTVPLQALYMMNNAFVRDQAIGFAKRLIGETADPKSRIRFACRSAWSREPSSQECERASVYLEECQRELAKAEVRPDLIELESWASYAKVLLTANEFLYLD